MKRGYGNNFWSTAFTLTGTVIGAGILGLPYVFSRSGFLVGMFWLIFLGIIMLFVNLYIGEFTLRTKGIHHLPGYAEIYLGNFWKKIMFFSLVFGIYSALIAYLIGEGQSFSQLFTGSLKYELYFGIGFWGIMTLMLKKGINGLKKIETYGVIVIIIIILGIFAWSFSDIDMLNLVYFNISNVFIPFGVVLFALLGFSCIPELRSEIKGNEKKFRKAIIVGFLIPIILYFLFSLSFVGVLGLSVPEVATLAFGPIITLLGIFTMLTSYFVLSFALKDIFYYDLNERKMLNFIFVSMIPLLVYLLISIFQLSDFVTVLGIGGAVSGGITAILALWINFVSKKKGKRKPEFSVPINLAVIFILSIVFVIGIIIELFF